MAQINCTEIKRGSLLDLDGAPWLVVDQNTQTPSARGASSIIKVKIKNLIGGQVLTKSYRGGEAVQLADCEKRSCQYLYRQQDACVFMDMESYEQFELESETLGESAGFLSNGLECLGLMYNGGFVSVELPTIVVLEVTETAPAIKNATAQAQLKSATLETGAEIQVPPYLTTGEKVKVDTRDGRFVGRAND